MIAQPIQSQPIVDDEGKMLQQFARLIQSLVQLQILTGIGSPEGVVSAKITTLYMDSVGSSGSILYLKRDADIGGDRSQGWIAV
ncbi:MAG: hypothetical protein V4563_17655 [Pseudomonadota bacterium]